MVESPEFVEQLKKSLINRIWNKLEESEDRRYMELSRRYHQLAVLRNLPSDFEMELKGFAAYVEHQTDLPLDRMLLGEIFEELVRADTEICPTPETVEAVLIRSLLRDPGIYGLHEEGIDERVRNPDAARIDESSCIVEAVEVKSGRIDRRGISQISMFKGNLENLVRKLGAIPQPVLQSHGLALITENLDQLQVSNDFVVTVAVPSGVYGGDLTHLIKEDEFSVRESEAAKKRLEECKIVESPFSRSDLRIVLNSVLEWLPVSLPTPA